MGRAGAGSDGGSSNSDSSSSSYSSNAYSSGSHSSGRSSGGHRASGGRAGSGGYGSGSYNSDRDDDCWGYPHRHYYDEYDYNDYPRYTPVRERAGGCLATLFVIGFFIGMLILFASVMVAVFYVPISENFEEKSSRVKLDTGIAYNKDCIIDELGWFEHINLTGGNLKEFYSRTGVQPYIVLKGYDATLTTDSEKSAYAEQYYKDNIDDESTFLFMYFAEEDADEDVGYMCYVNGKLSESVMDKEACTYFLKSLQDKWYSNLDTDDLFTTVFTDTYREIMPTKNDNNSDIDEEQIYATLGRLGHWVMIFGGIAIVLLFITYIIKTIMKSINGRNNR
jgi:hypothetical protein